MYVGSGFDPTTARETYSREHRQRSLCDLPKRGRSRNARMFLIGGDNTTLKKSYDSSTGILTVTLNLSAFANDFRSAGQRPLRSGEFL